jgi:hypothetical protein
MGFMRHSLWRGLALYRDFCPLLVGVRIAPSLTRCSITVEWTVAIAGKLASRNRWQRRRVLRRNTVKVRHAIQARHQPPGEAVMTVLVIRCSRAGSALLAPAMLGLSLVGGCIAPPVAPAPPAPELQLLGAAEFKLPQGCEATSGTVYRTHFRVQPDGRVTDAAAESGNGCVQQALRAWVTTFSYAPLRDATPVAFDWMIVTAARND